MHPIINSNKISLIATVYLFLCFAISYGQIPEDYNELRRYILADLAANDIEKAFVYTDSLANKATTTSEVIKAEMVRAVLHYQKGEVSQALDIAVDAEKAYLKDKNYKEQIAVIGFMASNFRELGINNEALYYLEKANKSINKLPEGHLKGQYGALINHEEIAIYHDLGKYNKASQHLQQAYEYIKQIEPGSQKDFFLATTLNLDAKNAFHLQEYKRSRSLLDQAYTTLGTENDLLYGQIQEGYAQLYIIEENHEKAEESLNILREMIEHSQYFPLKKQYYKLMSEYCKTVNNIECYVENYKLYLEAIHTDEKRSQKIADRALQELRAKIQTERIANNKKITISLVVILILVTIPSLMYYYNRKQVKRFKEVMKRLRAGQQLIPHPISSNNHKVSNTENNLGNVIDEVNISEDTEQRIFKGLSQLEADSNFYLQPEITLTKVATLLNTNTKYLSYVIRKYYEKNFNNYINDLRIYYILKQLQEKSEYSQYKISYLAQETGFSSHSKFSSEFKRVTGITPSVFIKKLEKEEA